MVQEVQHHPIDAVITWVDGLDPAHLKKRKSVMGSAPDLFHENAINPHRWACNGELYFCLHPLSITPHGCAKYGSLSTHNHQICRA